MHCEVNCLTEKVGTLGLRATSKNRCGASKKRARRARLAEALSGDSGGGQTRSAPGDQPQTLRFSGTNLRRVEGSQLAQASDSSRPGGLPKGGRLRGPNRLGNLVMPESLGRAFGWRLYVRTTRRVRSPKKTS